MVWYNPVTWFGDPAGDEFHAASPETQAAYDAQKAQILDPGTTHARSESNYWEGNNAEGRPYGGVDPRDFMYGRSATGADDAANRAWQTGMLGSQLGQQAAQGGNFANQTGANLLNTRTGDAAYFNGRQTGLNNANMIGNLETQQGPSAAQAQLMQGTNQAMNSQLALARSGRGFGGNAASAGLAETNLAGLQAGQANSAAALRAQEDAAWRQRQASNMLGANSQILQSQGQNDAMAQAMTGLGQQAYFQGAGLQQQGYGNALGGVQSDVGAQNLANQIRGQEMQGGQTQEDDLLRWWAAKNGFTLGAQQQQDQRNAGYMSAAGSFLGAVL
jgi:hypothetical protein